jgi:hypothetical protein
VVERGCGERRLPQVFADDELEAGPGVVHGADLDVDQAEGEGFGADGVFGDVGGDFRGFLGPRDPDGAGGREGMPGAGELGGEIGAGGDEQVRHLEAGLGCFEEGGRDAGLADLDGDAGGHGGAPGKLSVSDSEFFGKGRSGVSRGHGENCSESLGRRTFVADFEPLLHPCQLCEFSVKTSVFALSGIGKFGGSAYYDCHIQANSRVPIGGPRKK